jgi:hypothetical protein
MFTIILHNIPVWKRTEILHGKFKRLKEIGCEVINWIYMAENRVWWRALCKYSNDRLYPINVGTILIN